MLASVGRVGLGGFAAYCLYSLAVLIMLGAAWRAAAGEPAGKLASFGWARLVREAASDLLPFSQVGGLVLGARTLTDAGVLACQVYGSLVIDITMELASQLVFTLLGLVFLVSAVIDAPDAATLVWTVLGGTLALAAMVAALLLLQRLLPQASIRLARLLLPASVDAASSLGAELQRSYNRRRRIALCFLLNLAGWVATAFGAFAVLRMMDAPTSVANVLALESMIFLLRSVAFVIPGGLGVQETAYALLGPLLGLPAETALAVALVKRAREAALGLPTLLLWQALEMRRMLRRRRSPKQPGTTGFTSY